MTRRPRSGDGKRSSAEQGVESRAGGVDLRRGSGASRAGPRSRLRARSATAPSAPRSTSSKGSPAQPQSTVRSFGSDAKQMPWSQPRIGAVGRRQQMPALSVGVVQHEVEQRDRAAGGGRASGRASAGRPRPSTSIQSWSMPARRARRAAPSAARSRGRTPRTRATRRPRDARASRRGSRRAAARHRSACRPRAPRRGLIPADLPAHPDGRARSRTSRSRHRRAARRALIGARLEEGERSRSSSAAPPTARTRRPARRRRARRAGGRRCPRGDPSGRSPSHSGAGRDARSARSAGRRTGSVGRPAATTWSARRAKPWAIAAVIRTRSTSGPTGASSGTSSSSLFLLHLLDLGRDLADEERPERVRVGLARPHPAPASAPRRRAGRGRRPRRSSACRRGTPRAAARRAACRPSERPASVAARPRRSSSSTTAMRRSASTATWAFSSATDATRGPWTAWRKKVRWPGSPTVPAMKRSGSAKSMMRRATNRL